MKRFVVFYAGLLYDECDIFPPRWDYPDGVFIHDRRETQWYLLDHTPYLEDQIPKHLKLSLLLLS